MAGPIIIPMMVRTAFSFLSVSAPDENLKRSLARNLHSLSGISDDSLILFLLVLPGNSPGPVPSDVDGPDHHHNCEDGNHPYF